MDKKLQMGNEDCANLTVFVANYVCKEEGASCLDVRQSAHRS
jgi:hypothetical protein